MQERPLADPEKLLAHLDDWSEGDELPGRTLAYLKTGRLAELLEERGASELLAALEPWERGRADPTVVLEALRDGGLADILSAR